MLIESEIWLHLNCAAGRGNSMQNGWVEFSEWNEGFSGECWGGRA
jgi:hypothetical protein